ncbi:MAG: hypothetical protein K2I07_09645 [Lachnospiraceae bacterium]|nr:hypothetical protein [Lachnospiraceae bacterium]
MRKLKRLLISLVVAALVMGNVAALMTFTSRAEEDTQSVDEQLSDEAVSTDGSDTESEPTVTPAPQQIVTAGGTALEGAQAQAVKDFLAALEATEDFAVYADTFQSGCDHVEGNIAVNHLENENFLVKVEVPEGMEGGEYSYIGEASGLVGSTGTTVLHGDADLEGSINDEDGAKPAVGTQDADDTVLVDVSSAINIEDGTVDVEELASVLENIDQLDVDANEVAETIQINENLNRIADAADAMDQALQDIKVNETVAEEGKPVDAAACQAVDTVTDMLADNTLRKGDVVVIDISVAALTECAHAENSLQGSLSALYRANREVGATLLVRVNTEGTDTVSITVPMYQDEHGSANGYLIWDFGTFSGTINANSCVTAGVIVAPNAEQVVVTGLLEGRVVTDTYVREGSSETHQPWTTPTPTDTPTPTPTDTPPPTTTDTPEPTPTDTPEPTPTDTPEPTPTDTPEPTPTVTITDTPTPTSATPTPTTTVTITDTPVPLSDTPEGEVLGAKRTPVVPEQGEVLGARRAPQTGDTAEANMWLAVMFGAAAGLGTWAFLKKRDEKRAQA